MEPEDGCFWVYGTDEQQIIAFTDRRFEYLQELLVERKTQQRLRAVGNSQSRSFTRAPELTTSNWKRTRQKKRAVRCRQPYQPPHCQRTMPRSLSDLDIGTLRCQGNVDGVRHSSATRPN